MATVRQEKLAEAIIVNAKSSNPKNKKDLVASVGYTDASATKKATEIITSPGVQEALQARGFSLERAKEVVGAILDSDTSQDKDKLKAADMIFKVHGAYVPSPEQPAGNTYNFFLNPQVQQATHSFEEDLKRVLAENAP